MQDPKKQLEELLGKEMLDQKIRELNLEALSPVELKLEYIKLKKDGRKAAALKRAAEKRKRKKRLARTQRYHQRQRVQRWEAAAEGDWWPVLRTTWRKRKLPVEITEAEWNVNVSEHIPEGELFNVNRHDTSRGISLDNIYLTNNDGVILFDGKSHQDILS